MWIGVRCMKQFPSNECGECEKIKQQQQQRQTTQKMLFCHRDLTAQIFASQLDFSHLFTYLHAYVRHSHMKTSAIGWATATVVVVATSTLTFMEIPPQLWLLHYNQYIFVSFSQRDESLCKFALCFCFSTRAPSNERLTQTRAHSHLQTFSVIGKHCLNANVVVVVVFLLFCANDLCFTCEFFSI